MKGCVLVVDDEKPKRMVLRMQLERDGYEVWTAESAHAGLEEMREKAFDIVVTDLRMPGMDGLAFLEAIREQAPHTAVVMMTAYGSIETAVQAMKAGAADFLTKPFRHDELAVKLDRLMENRRRLTELTELRRRLESLSTYQGMVGQSPAMQRLFERIRKVARSDLTVLIQGETGTGKELVARALHEESHRREGPFVKVSCASLSREVLESELFGHEAGAFTGALKRRRGRFELAEGGTIFLDEVDDIPLELQVKLLQVIEEKRFERVGGEETLTADLRIVAATKRNLRTLVERGRFRADLYFRLHVIVLELPPLRDRPEDIPALTAHFMRRAAIAWGRDRLEIAPEALHFLRRHLWPGNVRELENTIERTAALVQGDRIEVTDLPPQLIQAGGEDRVATLHLAGRDRIDWPKVQAALEEEVIRWAMEKAGGSLSRAAAFVGVPRTTLRDRIRSRQAGGEGEARKGEP